MSEPWDLRALAEAIRAGWGADTCSPDDLERADWRPDNPAWGQCDITTALVNDLFGGALVMGEVRHAGERHGLHWWNRLPSGVDLDLTRDQFRLGQMIQEVRVVEWPPGEPLRREVAYRLLRERVARHLGPLPEPAQPTG